MGESLVRAAAEAFNQGRYAEAQDIYRQLADQLGEQHFRANLALCQRRMKGQLNVKLGDLNLKDLRVAAVMDEFTFHSFNPECQLLNLNAARWQEEIESFHPDFVFIESAWRGIDDSWQRKVSDPSRELDELIAWAMAHRISVVFWCKEDPVHFKRFLPVARSADCVFTTDLDSIVRYKEALGHNQVYLLPFAAQPTLHNPIEKSKRRDIFSFAGSWYPHYPDRQIDFRTLIGVGRKLKTVEIFDRNANRPSPHDFVFPEEFLDEICGSLPYTEMERAYKECRYGITINTIKQSLTMFARRAFELMASNTVVVSNFSKGLRLMFGDHVISSDNAAELERRLTPLCVDEGLYRRHRLRSLRKVLAEHTYEHRLAYVASKVLKRSYQVFEPRIAMLAEPADSVEVARLIEALTRQSWRHTTLVLVATEVTIAHPQVEVISSRQMALERLRNFDYVAPLSSNDYYGPDYLTDLALATRFAKGDGVTKMSFYTCNGQGKISLQEDGNQYTHVGNAALRRSLLRPVLLKEWATDSNTNIFMGHVGSSELVAADEFNYCSATSRHPDVASYVDAEPFLRPGIPFFTQMLPQAEAIKAPDSGKNMALCPKDWYQLLPEKIDHHLDFRLTDKEYVEVTSNLPDKNNQYCYFKRKFSFSELYSGDEFFFQFEADTSLNVLVVFVFLDSEGKKISHVMKAVGVIHAIRIPSNAAWVRMALRIEGGGGARLGKFSFVKINNNANQILPTAKHLVVAKQYPSYEDLYRYAFVHSRIRAYAKAGVSAQILRVSPDPQVVYREFEGVDVTQADLAYLERCLSAHHYRSIVVHIIDQAIWRILVKYLDDVHVVIWAHGSEIQPWWRRAMSYSPDQNLDNVRRYSDNRMAMWQEIFGLNHPNLRVVFISNKQANEALSDLQLAACEVKNIEVISNFIDGDLFRYEQKDPELRHRLLSIRPFVSQVYANDLTVAAILRLAREPFFSQLQFHIIGDGLLFDETVAPLRSLENVRIERRFLTQHEIALLHREYGVFMVPSRMDSQGVSRDEAMASGLVPITNRVAAIPEFVDGDCGFLAEPEDAAGIADAVRCLHEDPELFARMSISASKRVRIQSGFDQTIARELSIIACNADSFPRTQRDECQVSGEAFAIRLALYGDVNLNIMDGSAIWAASLAEVLAGITDVRVALVLKARIQRTQVISRLLDMTPAVQLIEPAISVRIGLTPAEAVCRLVALDEKSRFFGLILRGLDLCHTAANEPVLRGRLWAYLTDIPQKAELMDAATCQRIETIIDASAYVLCQTPQMRDYFVSLFPQASEKARLLPPMVPLQPSRDVDSVPFVPFRFSYAGKFAPRWGIRDLFAAQKKLYATVPDAELHVFGDKVHNPADDPNFRTEVNERLAAGNGLFWHGAVDRDELLRRLSGMHACWAYRDPVFERETLELSTKVLEYASLSLPMILARSQVFEELLGVDYPLFATTAEEAADLLLQLASDPAFRKAAAVRLEQAAARYTFAAVRERLIDDGLIPRHANGGKV